MHPRIQERRLDVGFAACMEIVKPRGRVATARERFEDETNRAYIRRAAAAGQITENEFHALHGYVSLVFGCIGRDGRWLTPRNWWAR